MALCAILSKQNKVAGKRRAFQQLYVILNAVKDPYGRSAEQLAQFRIAPLHARG